MDERVDLLELAWAVNATRPSSDLAVDFLATTQGAFPTAMPRTFGDVEPLRRGTMAGFVAMWESSDACYWRSGGPIVAGHAAFPSTGPWGNVTATFLLRDVQSDVDVQVRVVDYFVDVAVKLAADFSIARVERDWQLTRGRLSYVVGQSTTSGSLTPRGSFVEPLITPQVWLTHAAGALMEFSPELVSPRLQGDSE